MEKGLDELIEFLVGEIASCGVQGATLIQVVDFVNSFYTNSRAQSPDSTAVNAISSAAVSPASQHVDQCFIFQVWKWLGRHRDIAIGENGQHNTTPLQRFWPRRDNPESSPEQASEDTPRVFVSGTRISQESWGSSQQLEKIFGKETELLSHITAAGRDGILQGELGRITGQDKRSVPKRTDSLRDKGYIVKEPVYIRGTKTSRLTLRKYARNQNAEQHRPSQQDHSQRPDVRNIQNVRHVVDKISNLTSNEALVEFENLASLVGLADAAEKKALMRIVRLMERSTCIKRVRTAFGPSAHSGDLKTCVQFLRFPTDTDSEVFAHADAAFERPFSELVAEELTKMPFSPSLPDSTHELPTHTSTDVAQWHPDRCIANVLSDAARRAGVTGLSYLASRNLITGPFIRRPLESLLARLSYHGLASQPEHLRHLAVVRTTRVVGGSLEYVHFSTEALSNAPSDKTVNFAAIPGKELLKLNASQESIMATDANGAGTSAVQDPFGFLAVVSAPSMPQDGAGSLTELIQATRASDILPRVGEPAITKDDLGHDVLGKVSPAGTNSEKQLSRKRFQQSRINPPRRLAEEKKNRGRPRKFPPGSEKFWQRHFRQARLKTLTADEELSTRRGTMTDPAGIALFKSRPQDFDETLSAAQDARLPLPTSAEDISAAWVLRIRKILSRSETGAYITPVGILAKNAKCNSQMLIVRSTRLSTLDLSDKPRPPKFRFISSSVAHSFAIQRSLLEPKQPSTSSRSMRKRKLALGMKVKKAMKKGPRMGVFFENPTVTESGRPAESPKPISVSFTTSEYQQVMDLTDSDSGLNEETTVQSLVSPLMTRHDSFATRPSSVDSARQSSRTASREFRTNKVSDDRTPRTRLQRKRMPSRKAAELLNSGKVEVGLTRPTSLSHPPATVHEPAHKFSQDGQTTGRDHDRGHVPEDRFVEETATADDLLTLFGASKRNEPSKAAIETTLSPVETSHRPTSEKQNDHSVQDEESMDGGIVDELNLMLPADHTSATPQQLANPNERALGDVERQLVQTEVVGDENKQNEQIPSDAESSQLSPAGGTESQTRKSSDVEAVDVDPHLNLPRQVDQHRPSQAQNSKRCRKILVDLVMLASGVAPNEHVTFGRVMVNRWQAEGGHGRPFRDLVKNNLKSLGESGRLRFVGFSFRGKGGILRKKSIVTHPAIDPADPLIESMKRKIIEADPAEYVPPKWQAETLPTLNAPAKKRKAAEEAQRPPIQEVPRIPQMETEQSDEDSQPPRTASAKRNKRRREGIESTESVVSSSRRRWGSEISEISVSSTVAAFLTLKVPRLGELAQVRSFNAGMKAPTWMSSTYRPSPGVGSVNARAQYFSADLADPIRFNPNTSTEVTTLPTPTVRRRRVLRRKAKAKRFDHASHEIIYEKISTDFPQSLHDILLGQMTYNPTTEVNSREDEMSRFFSELEIVEAWEDRCQAQILSSSFKWHFINHATAQAESLRCSSEYWLQVNLVDGVFITEKPIFEFPSWPPFVDTLSTSTSVESPVSHVSLQSEDVSASQTPQPADLALPKVRRKATKANDVRQTQASRILNKMSKQVFHRVAMTIICVRTLTGGIDKTIDWSIIQPLLSKYGDEALLAECWDIILESDRLDTHAYTEEFQEKYIEALESGYVPTVNFNDLHGTEWDEIVSWAIRSLDSDATRGVISELPATRSQLLRKYEMNLSHRESIAISLQPDPRITKARREQLYGATVFGSSLVKNTFANRSHTTSHIQSFILSIVLCPESRYSQDHVQARLQSLATTATNREALLRPAFQVLHDKLKLIALRSGSIKPDGPRKYSATAKFFEQFGEKNCLITAGILTDAARYKAEILDEGFYKGETVILEKDTRIESGEMLALMQLLGMSALEIKPGVDVPRSRYGVAWDRVGYQTKLLKPEDFGFGAVVQKKEGYITGDVWGKRVSVDVPMGDTERWDRTPIWVDISGSVVEETWEMVLGAVLGIVSLRPGIEQEEVSKMLGYAVGAWEVQVMLEWAEKMGFVKKTKSGRGWETREWWWLCLGIGRGEGREGDEDGGDGEE